MDDYVEIRRDERHIAREREKARQLKQSAWWRNELAKGICHYCGGHFAPEELTMDHVVPVARGGRSVRGNVVPCCLDCNQKKKFLTPAEIILRELAAQTPPDAEPAAGEAAELSGEHDETGAERGSC